MTWDAREEAAREAFVHTKTCRDTMAAWKRQWERDCLADLALRPLAQAWERAKCPCKAHQLQRSP